MGARLHGEVADELLELVAARDKVRLAVHLHQHAQPAPGRMHVNLQSIPEALWADCVLT